MKEELTIAVGHKASGLSDQPQDLPPFVRPFPDRTGKRAVIWHEEAEGDIPRGSARLQRIVNGEELDETVPLVVGRHKDGVERVAVPARHTLQAGSSDEAQPTVRITGNRKGRNGEAGRETQAQAQPGLALPVNPMALGAARNLRHQFGIGWQPKRVIGIGDVNDHHIGGCVR